MQKQHLHPSILRAYDIRGVVGDTLRVSDGTVIGHAFAAMMRQRGYASVSVARDGRLSSPAIHGALIEGITAGGVDVFDVGLCPTPMLYAAAKLLPTDAGIMITGSHNPSSYNGFKMVMGDEPLFGDDIQALGRLASGEQDTAVPAGRRGAMVPVATFGAIYADHLIARSEVHKRIKVVWDTGNGTAGPMVQALIRRLPGSHVLINAEVDGTFPSHHPDPTVPENLSQLRAAVIQERADIGLAFDGDGDRVGAVDHMGRIVQGDQLLAILARAMLAEMPGATVITDVKTSRAVLDDIEAAGGVPVMWKTGHSLIKKKMKELSAALAGEMSGHIFFADRYFGFDDALYASLRLLEAVQISGKPLAAMLDELPTLLNTPEIRIQCDEDLKAPVMVGAGKLLEAVPDVRVSTLDGLRVTTDEGWWLLRPSNTQDVLVARCEADTQAGLGRMRNMLDWVLSETLGRSSQSEENDDTHSEPRKRLVGSE